MKTRIEDILEKISLACDKSARKKNDVHYVATIDAITKDNVVEAISHTKLPIIGVQWHPERMPKLKRNVYFADGDKLLSYFLSLI